jgi:hypothetical protein
MFEFKVLVLCRRSLVNPATTLPLLPGLRQAKLATLSMCDGGKPRLPRGGEKASSAFILAPRFHVVAPQTGGRAWRVDDYLKMESGNDRLSRSSRLRLDWSRKDDLCGSAEQTHRWRAVLH